MRIQLKPVRDQFYIKHNKLFRFEISKLRWLKTRKMLVLFTSFLLTLLLSACDFQLENAIGNHPLLVPTATSIAPQTYPVDKIFKEFYQTLGGQAVLGPAISLVEDRDGLKCQFTEATQMCFNSAITGPDRFRLYQLGHQLKLHQDAPIDAGLIREGARVVNGIEIYEKFVAQYDRLYGARYVGRPLTRLRFNYELHRVEQFFENVGFYQDFSYPNAEVKLISYGAYMCGAQCSYKLPEYWGIVKSNLIEQPFSQSIGRLGGPAIFGEPLLQPSSSPDGYVEQVYTNGIFYGLLNDPSIVQMRPLPLQLKVGAGPLVPRKVHEKLVFYEIQPGLGHNVPIHFDEFIALHGGKDLSGEPISEVYQVENQNLYQQCFENYCLVFDPVASESLKIRLLPLGKQYLSTFPPDENQKPENIFTPDRIALFSGVDRPNLDPNQEQHIRIVVQQNGKLIEDVKALDRVEGTLLLTFPDGTTARYFFPPTDGEGRSAVVIPPQPNLKHGDRLVYTACLNLPSELPICDMQSYLIWDSK
jgi:hypothetical protein